MPKFIDAATGRADGGKHGHAEALREFLAVDVPAIILGHVDHVAGDHGGKFHLDDLRREVEIAFEIVRVDDDEHGIGRQLAVDSAEQCVAGDLFVWRSCGKTVGAGQVDQRRAGPFEQPFMSFDGDAGIVGDLQAQSGERVEDGGLARIGITDDGNAMR